jgi:hypothetical protein
MKLPSEDRLWRDGFVGYMVRALYRLTWQRIQFLPADEHLWRAFHQRDQVYATGELKPSFFRDRSGLSCDLARFSNPEASRRGHSDKMYPAEAGLVEFRVLDVRAVGSDVEHDPVKRPRQSLSFGRPISTLLARTWSTLRLWRRRHNYAHSKVTSPIRRPDGEEYLATVASFRIQQRLRV